LSKVIRLVWHRWWLILAFGFVGAFVAFVTTNGLIQRAKPGFEASAAITIEVSNTGASNSGSGSRSNSPVTSDESESVESVLSRAVEVNSQAIDARTGQVTYDERSSELRFISKSRDEASAIRAAEGMRSAYLDATNEALSASRSARLEEIVIEAGDILAKIQAAEPETVAVAPVPDAVQARLDLLLSLEDALKKQYTNLEVDLVLANAGDERVGTPSEVQQELEFVTARLEEITAEVALLASENGLDAPRGRESAVPVTPEPAANPRGVTSASDTEATPGNLADVWTLDALEAQYATLSLEYRELSLLPAEPATPVLADPDVRDLSPNYGTPLLNTFLGLLGGILIAIGLIMAENVLKPRIRDWSDLRQIAVLAELPALGAIRRASRASNRAHDSRARSARLLDRRSVGIMQLRNSLVSIIDESGIQVVGVTGISVAADEVLGTALDLAGRLVASDRRVIVLGLDFGDELSSVGADSDSVSALLAAIRTDTETGVGHLKELLASSSLVRPTGVRVLASGDLVSDPTDVVHTRAFRSFLSACREDSEIVLAVVSEANSPATHSFLYGLDGVLAVCATHVSSQKDVEKFTTAVSRSGASMLGAVLLSRYSARKERDELAEPVAITARAKFRQPSGLSRRLAAVAVRPKRDSRNDSISGSVREQVLAEPEGGAFPSGDSSEATLVDGLAGPASRFTDSGDTKPGLKRNRGSRRLTETKPRVASEEAAFASGDSPEATLVDGLAEPASHSTEFVLAPAITPIAGTRNVIETAGVAAEEAPIQANGEKSAAWPYDLRRGERVRAVLALDRLPGTRMTGSPALDEGAESGIKREVD
jgi:capsular polysaccharide biosynthesis protein